MDGYRSAVLMNGFAVVLATCLRAPKCEKGLVVYWRREGAIITSTLDGSVPVILLGNKT